MQNYYPSEGEYIAIGTFGVILFLVIICLAIFYLTNRSKSYENKIFYSSIIIMSIFELPRYFDLIVTQTYTSTSCYAVHIVADMFFFVCIAMVVLTFAHILELGPSVSVIYSKRGLVVAGVMQGIINLTAVIYCASAESLHDFFLSSVYLVFTIFDVVQNLFYSSVLTIYGCRLIISFNNYKAYSTSKIEKQVFQVVVHKVTSILLVTTIFGLCRLTILAVKIAAQYSTETITTVRTYTFWTRC